MNRVVLELNGYILMDRSLRVECPEITHQKKDNGKKNDQPEQIGRSKRPLAPGTVEIKALPILLFLPVLLAVAAKTKFAPGSRCGLEQHVRVPLYIPDREKAVNS
jgi:hypothetical protein